MQIDFQRVQNDDGSSEMRPKLEEAAQRGARARTVVGKGDHTERQRDCEASQFKGGSPRKRSPSTACTRDLRFHDSVLSIPRTFRAYHGGAPSAGSLLWRAKPFVRLSS